MIIPLQGYIATQDLRKTLSQLRGFQQETEIVVLRKITHAYRKGDKEEDGPLASFALNCMVMFTDWHDPGCVRISVRMTLQCGTLWRCCLSLISGCPQDTVSNGGVLLGIDLWAECLAYILISWFCMKTLDEPTGSTLLYTSLLQLAAWNCWVECCALKNWGMN